MWKVSPIKFSGPESKKLKELVETLDSKLDDENIADYYSSAKKDELLKNKDKLLKIIQKEIDNIIEKVNNATRDWFKKDFWTDLENVNDKTIQSIFNITEESFKDNYLSIYIDTIEKLKKEIFELEDKKDEELRQFVFDKIRKYKPKDSKEKDILFVPVLEQDIYDEYDILIFVKNELLTEKEKKELIEKELNFDLEISRLNVKLVNYLEENQELERIKELYSMKKAVLEEDFVLWLKKYFDILEKNKFEYEETDYKDLYKEEIELFNNAVIKGSSPYGDFLYDEWKLVEIRKLYYKNTFEVPENKGYFRVKDILVIEEYYDKENIEYNKKYYKTIEEQYIDFNEEIDKDIIKKFEKNKNLKFLVTKKDVVIREQYRKDIEVIKEVFVEFLKKNKLNNLLNNAYIYHFLYEDENGNEIDKKEEYIKLV